MTNEEIKSYFGGGHVYSFGGNLSELESLMIENNASFNTLIANYGHVYFTAALDALPVDERIQEI